VAAAYEPFLSIECSVPTQASVSTETPATRSAVSASVMVCKCTRVSGVNEQHRLARAQFLVQQIRRDQPTGIADDAGDGLSPTQPDMQRHHCSLGEADEHCVAFA